MLTILEKLHKIDQQKIIYNIHRCRAGWGIIFYYPDKEVDGNWRTALSTDRYYKSFEGMIEGEYVKMDDVIE